MQAIAKMPLDGGGLKLTATRPPATAAREKARIITMAWGDRYINDLLTLTIPALLAPGNVPAFVEHFDSEFTLVTERRFFDDVMRAPVIARLREHCGVRLLPIDDLLSSWYGITLTYALVRGFADLGPAMRNTHLVFLNADFIVADGSYRKLAEMIRRGDRLVVAPSYCTVLEDVVGEIRRHYDPATATLSIAPRDMAALVISHRHNTIRAKTVNQRLFRIHRYDQFYWYVSNQTMLARQMPISVIYMRPERVLTEMPTFWDYGVISEFCPNAKPCVLGDSDDFLMAELRTRDTFRELLNPGWPSIEEIAADLSSFTTHDHRVYGQFTLTLHSADLPPDIEVHRKHLAEFSDAVYARLGPEISYINHPFWASSFPLFASYRELQGVTREETERIRAGIRGSSAGSEREKRIEALHSGVMRAEAELQSIRSRFGPLRQPLAARRSEIEAAYARARDEVSRAERALDERQEREEKAVSRRIDGLRDKIAALRRDEQREVGAALGRQQPRELRRRARARLRDLNYASPRMVSRLTHLYRAVFGNLSHTTAWHPYHATLEPVQAALQQAARGGQNLLAVASESGIGSRLAASLVARTLIVSPAMASQGLVTELQPIQREFDLCFICLSAKDLPDLPYIMARVQPALRRDAPIVVFYHHTQAMVPDLLSCLIELPTWGLPRIAFTGTRPGAWATRLIDIATRNYNVSLYTHLFKYAVTLAACAPLAQLATWLEKHRDPQRLPDHLTGMVIVIEPDQAGTNGKAR